MVTFSAEGIENIISCVWKQIDKNSQWKVPTMKKKKHVTF